ncbi:MAG TPA: iron-sulfur cluster assembly scaffold protein [Thermodesulfobacteriota bacterium]|nr:iron-sulfur cluster assembly scaffold protein [Thermodesulfobacteriota bacterium]
MSAIINPETNMENQSTELSDVREMLLSSGYAEKAIEYFLTKPNQGPLEGADLVTELTGPCGDTMKCYLKVNEGVIKDTKFQVLGCPGAISAAMALADLVRGKNLSQALEVKDGDVFRELVQIPDQKQHCIRLAVKTLEKAIREYQDKSL